MEFINKKTVVDSPYEAELNGVKINLHAPSMAAARQRALEYFRPKKKERDLITVRPL